VSLQKNVTDAILVCNRGVIGALAGFTGKGFKLHCWEKCMSAWVEVGIFLVLLSVVLVWAWACVSLAGMAYRKLTEKKKM